MNDLIDNSNQATALTKTHILNHEFTMPRMKRRKQKHAIDKLKILYGLKTLLPKTYVDLKRYF